MASWKEERDRLVAQTLAFVQQVAAARPAPTQSITGQPASDRPIVEDHVPQTVDGAVAPSSTSPSPSDAALPDSASIDASDHARNAAPSIPPSAIGATAGPALYSRASERAEILQRVTAFKARQSLLSREREAYYETVQAQIRHSLRNDSGRERL